MKKKLLYALILFISINACTKVFITEDFPLGPYKYPYTNISGLDHFDLYAWRGDKVMILSRTDSFNKVTMNNWVKTMDLVFDYYKICTGKEPENTSASNSVGGRIPIANVSKGTYLSVDGSKGIELSNFVFDYVYDSINKKNEYGYLSFYNMSRNFWFYNKQLSYKSNDPIAAGYAEFMGIMAKEAVGVSRSQAYRNDIEKLIDTYLADPTMTWANTLGSDKGVSYWSSSILFSSFCFRLRRDYGGEAFVKKIWIEAGNRPAAFTTQDAVDNFFLASCAAANKNLSTVFKTWKWTISASAVSAAAKYP
jgi:hypothetical protein